MIGLLNPLICKEAHDGPGRHPAANPAQSSLGRALHCQRSRQASYRAPRHRVGAPGTEIAVRADKLWQRSTLAAARRAAVCHHLGGRPLPSGAAKPAVVPLAIVMEQYVKAWE
jgi:hypothetical protein